MHLLMLPGMDGTGRLFEPLCNALPASLTPIVVSYPNDGCREYAELLPLVEAAIPVDDDFVVLAESYSGPLTILLAALKPKRLRGMIFSASFARSPVPRFIGRLSGMVCPLSIRCTPKWLIHWALLGQHRNPALQDLLAAALRDVPAAVLSQRIQSITKVDAREQLRSCTIPMLYLQATDDRLVSPRNFIEIQRVCPAINIVRLQGPHLLLQVNPSEAARVINDFVSSL